MAARTLRKHTPRKLPRSPVDNVCRIVLASGAGVVFATTRGQRLRAVDVRRGRADVYAPQLEPPTSLSVQLAGFELPLLLDAAAQTVCLSLSGVLATSQILSMQIGQ
ncbi:MAG: hypothetical protein ACI85K_003040 [Hyphomicrobiaceae bacterium]|jgi:hypothetical protein